MKNDFKMIERPLTIVPGGEAYWKRGRLLAVVSLHISSLLTIRVAVNMM